MAQFGKPSALPTPVFWIVLLSASIWVYLLLCRGGFWRCAERLGNPPAPANWPAVTAIVPARDEAEVIEEALSSLLEQDYAGDFSVILVDDHSRDGTADLARKTAAQSPQGGRLSILQAPALPEGWTGKLWALEQGLRRVDGRSRYIWFSDADITQPPDALTRLVAKAENDRRDLVSLMVALRCEGFWERLLIPPFIYFFQKLYPFAWVNDPDRRTAAAAGGCILIRQEALIRIGGLAALSDALIDDCSLAAKVKEERQANSGGIWLGLAERARSIRPYAGLGSIWTMVARTAYTQLANSPAVLLGTLIGMFLTYLAPPLALLSYPWHLNTEAAVLGGLVWTAMTASLLPVLRLYGQSPWLAALLPLAAALYSAMTIDSARRHWQGSGGNWKGRIQARSQNSD